MRYDDIEQILTKRLHYSQTLVYDAIVENWEPPQSMQISKVNIIMWLINL